MFRRFSSLLPFIGILAVAATYLMWAGLRWQANFNADEASYGIVARDILNGHGWPIYLYGMNYGGTLTAYFCVPFVWLLNGSVAGLRLGSTILFLLFLTLQGIFVSKIWEPTVAWISMLLLSIPFVFGIFLIGPMPGIAMYMSLSTGAMIAFFCWKPTSTRMHFLRIWTIGFLMGLALWCLPLTRLYAIVLLFIAFLQLEEWTTIRTWIGASFKALHPLLRAALSAVLFAALALVVLKLTYSRQLHTAVPIVVTLGFFCIVASKRKLFLLSSLCVLLLGFAMGNAPQWGAWVFLGIAPDSSYYPSIPTLADFQQMFLAVFPLVLNGVNIPTLLANHEWIDTFFGAAWFIIALVSLLFFAWHSKTAIRRLFAFRIEQEDTGKIALLLLFLLPLLAIPGLDSINSGMIRYATPSWQAAAVIMAIEGTRFLRRSGCAFAIVLLIWMMHIGVNIALMSGSWPAKTGMFQKTNIDAMTTYLHERGVVSGFANYWLAQPVQYITKDELLIAADGFAYRNPRVADAAYNAKRFVYIFGPPWGNWLQPGAITTGPELSALLRKERHDVDGKLLERIERATVEERKTLLDWTFWILQDPDGPSS